MLAQVSGFDEPKNKIDIGYNVTIRDHPDLFNGSKHWVGAGMRSGYQMLWVGQEAMYIYKVGRVQLVAMSDFQKGNSSFITLD